MENVKTKDVPTTIEVPLDNDNKILIQRRNPFGLVYMELAKGTLPEKYQGAYTTYEYAQLDAQRYIEERSKELEYIEKNIPKAKSKAA